MKATLIKKSNIYYLYIDESWAIASTDERDNRGKKLSLKNCQAIELGYDLDELAETEASKRHNWDDHDDTDIYNDLIREDADLIKIGMQKALELLGDKKFSEEDMINFAWWFLRNVGQYSSDENAHFDGEYFKKWKSLQQTEWDVEIIKETTSRTVNGNTYFVTENKLDSDGCLILKHI